MTVRLNSDQALHEYQPISDLTLDSLAELS
jgi:hypothetical protein